MDERPTSSLLKGTLVQNATFISVDSVYGSFMGTLVQRVIAYGLLAFFGERCSLCLL